MSRLSSFGICLGFLALVSIVGCHGCFLDVKEVKYGNDNYTRIGIDEEEDDKNLVKYIANRTVMIKGLCKILDYKGKVIRGYKAYRFGSGTIIKSTRNTSLVQTAYHVVEKIDRFFYNRKYGVANVICDRYHVETRWPDNKVRDYYIDVEVLHYDKFKDIAVLGVLGNMQYSSKIAKQDNYLGQRVVNLAYPSLIAIKGDHLSFSMGYVATINMNNKTRVGSKWQVRFIMDGYFGSSGSGIWDKKGRLIGVLTNGTGFRTRSGFIMTSITGPGTKALRDFYATKNLNVL